MLQIAATFAALKTSRRKAFIPFITAGDPDLEFTAAVLGELAARGASLCEVGIPYSDPIADGPVIQASYTRALATKIKLADIFRMLGSLGGSRKPPLVTMVSYAIVYRQGMAAYVAEARKASVAGLIVPDLPHEEAGELAKICSQEGLSLIQLVTPTTSRERAIQIANTTTGFLYYVSVAGITGERTQLPADLVENVSWLRARTPVPVCIGFGVSTPDHVRQLAPVCDGLIVGSALVKRMAEAGAGRRSQVLAEIGAYAASLIAALDEAAQLS